MTDEKGVTGGLDGFGDAARQAVQAGAAEARLLGSSRLGTEHLLLGIVATASCGAAAALRREGVSLAAARRKAAETTIGASDAAGPPHRSPRADRALNRAFRFAHDDRCALVRTEHLLLGVLEVEGTSGQVLRGLGVDLEALRARLQTGGLSAPEEADPAMPAPPAAAEHRPPVCPGCAAPVADGVAVSLVPAGGREAVVVSCPSCGIVLGAAPA